MTLQSLVAAVTVGSFKDPDAFTTDLVDRLGTDLEGNVSEKLGPGMSLTRGGAIKRSEMVRANSSRPSWMMILQRVMSK